MMQFSTPDELRRHYAEVTQRLWGSAPPSPRKVVIPPPPPPERPKEKPANLPCNADKYEMVPLPGADPRLKFRDVVRAVGEEVGMTEAEIFARRRNLKFTQARHLCWALHTSCCLHLSLPIIGRLSGGYDHSTVLHGARNGVKDPRFAELKQKLEAILEERRAAVPKEEEGVHGSI
jgi:hypothetical protein